MKRHSYSTPYLLLVIFLFSSGVSFAQLNCDSTFTDSGGEFFRYSENEYQVTTICPEESGSRISLLFDFVDIAVDETGNGNQGGCWDYMSIYNGPDTLSPYLAQTLCGEVSQSGQAPSLESSLLLEGDQFSSTHPGGCLTVRFKSDHIINEHGWAASILCSDPCEGLDTAPVGLTKSFQPVPYPNGVVDRVQLKFYKALPNVKYPAHQNVAVDIQFWPVKYLSTGLPIANPDTSLLAMKTKPGQDFFKWPVKFIRPDVDPLVRYKWRVRVHCQDATVAPSPWSEIKIFNTPAFDPFTGIYSEGSLEENHEHNKTIRISLTEEQRTIRVQRDEASRDAQVFLIDTQGRLLNATSMPHGRKQISIEPQLLGQKTGLLQVIVQDGLNWSSETILLK